MSLSFRLGENLNLAKILYMFMQIIFEGCNREGVCCKLLYVFLCYGGNLLLQPMCRKFYLVFRNVYFVRVLISTSGQKQLVMYMH